MISGRTEIIAHLGYPTESFTAPMIYNPWFEAHGIDAVGCRRASAPSITRRPRAGHPSGRDVVTLGVSGAGSVEGMAAFPAIAYARSERAWYLRLPPPRVAVVYFYEGNDLNNNLRFLERRVEHPEAADAVERIERAIAAYPPQLSAPAGWARHFPLLRFLRRVAWRVDAEQTSAIAPEASGSDDAAGEADPPNTVEVAGRAVRLPANLQSPSMELTGQELEQAALVYDRSLAFLR